MAKECEMCDAFLSSRDDWMHLANIRSQEIARLMNRASELEAQVDHWRKDSELRREVVKSLQARIDALESKRP